MERLPGMRFCGRCGLDFEGADAAAEKGAPGPAPPTPVRPEPATTRALMPMPLVAIAALVGVGLIIYFGFFAGRTPAGPTTPSGAAQPGTASASPAATPLPVGLTIVSPADGAVVATKKVVVIGTAPPGLTITQDISLGLDRHTPVDGTGHWAMEMELTEGDNQMTFRIGDDKSTARTIHVAYQPPPAPS
jgi:hypothetical protein